MVEPDAVAVTGELDWFKLVDPAPANAEATIAAVLFPLWLYGALAVKVPTLKYTIPES